MGFAFGSTHPTLLFQKGDIGEADKGASSRGGDGAGERRGEVAAGLRVVANKQRPAFAAFLRQSITVAFFRTIAQNTTCIVMLCIGRFAAASRHSGNWSVIRAVLAQMDTLFLPPFGALSSISERGKLFKNKTLTEAIASRLARLLRKPKIQTPFPDFLPAALAKEKCFALFFTCSFSTAPLSFRKRGFSFRRVFSKEPST
jgi:hypothetical protein